MWNYSVFSNKIIINRPHESKIKQQCINIILKATTYTRLANYSRQTERCKNATTRSKFDIRNGNPKDMRSYQEGHQA